VNQTARAASRSKRPARARIVGAGWEVGLSGSVVARSASAASAGDAATRRRAGAFFVGAPFLAEAPFLERGRFVVFLGAARFGAGFFLATLALAFGFAAFFGAGRFFALAGW